MRKILVYKGENTFLLFFCSCILENFSEDCFLTIHICIIMASESLNPTSYTRILAYMPFLSYQEPQKPKHLSLKELAMCVHERLKHIQKMPCTKALLKISILCIPAEIFAA